MLCGRAYIEAALARWVSGGRVYWHPKSRFMADLEPPPPEVWEIRVTEPRTQGRLFGRFVEADTLVLTAFHTRGHLGDRGSQGWIDAMADCVNQWDAFSPSLPVLSAPSIHSYITENYDDFPIKRVAQPKGPRRIRRR